MTSKINFNPLAIPMFLKSKNLTLEAGVIFGSRRCNCCNTGICKVEQWKPIKEHKKAILTLIGFSLGADQIQFNFPKENIGLNIVKQHWPNSQFTVLEDFYFSSIFIKKLNLQYTCIRRGIYPVVENKENYQITFKLYK